jgi:hypothetical protein
VQPRGVQRPSFGVGAVGSGSLRASWGNRRGRRPTTIDRRVRIRDFWLRGRRDDLYGGAVGEARKVAKNHLLEVGPQITNAGPLRVLKVDDLDPLAVADTSADLGPLGVAVLLYPAECLLAATSEGRHR